VFDLSVRLCVRILRARRRHFSAGLPSTCSFNSISGLFRHVFLLLVFVLTYIVSTFKLGLGPLYAEKNNKLRCIITIMLNLMRAFLQQ